MVKSGYMTFLTAYDWTFRRRYATLTTESGRYVYEMPEDFGGLRTPFHFSEESGYPPVRETSEGVLMEYRGYGENNSYPENFAIRAGHYSPETGQVYETMFWPTPNSDHVLYYSYYMMPPMMGNDDDVPMGGQEHSECILRFCLAAAEQEQDESQGVQSKEIGNHLQRSIAMDKLKEPRNVGRIKNMSAFEVARGSYRINDITGFTD